MHGAVISRSQAAHACFLLTPEAPAGWSPGQPQVPSSAQCWCWGGCSSPGPWWVLSEGPMVAVAVAVVAVAVAMGL